MDRRAVFLVVSAGVVVLAGCSASAIGPDPSPPGTAPRDSIDITATPTETGGDSVNGTFEVHFINVGQSVSTLVVGPTGETMLIDSGYFNDDGQYVLQYLKQHDVDRIDYLVTSHAHSDHIGGHAAVIEYYETEADGVGAVYDPGLASSSRTYEEYLDAVERHDVTLYETRARDDIPFEGVDVRVLGPPEPYIANEDKNENSIVLQLGFGATNFLHTGDAERRQENHLVETYGESLQSTIMKAGHHESNSSTDSEILDVVESKAVAISSAYNSQFGHPFLYMLDRLSERNVPAYWMATHGNVVFVSDGSRVVVKTQREAPTDPESLRNGSAFVLYVDGSSRGNPGPAGAGAVIMDAEENSLARLGRPVGFQTGNNTAEYVALQLGLAELLSCYEPGSLEVRIDSMTVIRDVWGGDDPTESDVETYSEAVAAALASVPDHWYTHLADSDPNPADALATVGADIAALGSG